MLKQCIHELVPYFLSARSRITALFNQCVDEVVSCLINALVNQFPNQSIHP
jgi:hypothetical protein